MFLCACPLDLVLTPIGEDIVHNAVFLAVVLMKAAPRTAYDQVVFHDHARRSFVRIQSPAAVIVGNHIMEIVVVYCQASHHYEGYTSGVRWDDPDTIGRAFAGPP